MANEVAALTFAKVADGIALRFYDATTFRNGVPCDAFLWLEPSSKMHEKTSTTSSKTTSFQALMRFYEAEGRYSASGDSEDRKALLALLHPEIILHQPPSLPYGGEWRGREAFGRWLDSFAETWTDITPTDPFLHQCGEDVLISTVTMHARARSTGIEIVMPMCQIIRFADGLPIEWRNFAWDTAQMLDALKISSTGERRSS